MGDSINRSLDRDPDPAPRKAMKNLEWFDMSADVAGKLGELQERYPVFVVFSAVLLYDGQHEIVSLSIIHRDRDHKDTILVNYEYYVEILELFYDIPVLGNSHQESGIEFPSIDGCVKYLIQKFETNWPDIQRAEGLIGVTS